MTDILERIVESRRRRVPEIVANGESALRAARSREPFLFASTLCRDGINIIAEVKAASPSAGTIVEDPDVEAIATAYRDGGAAAISVVTEPEFFKGSLEWLGRARASSCLPVLMKDFVVDAAQILEGVTSGADAMLLIAAVLDTSRLRALIALLAEFGCDALVEVHDDDDLDRALKAGARLIGVNNRNLRDFSVDLGTSERLSKKMPVGVIRVAESGIRSREDIERLRLAGFNAFLVGESLLRQTDRAEAVRALAQTAHGRQS